MYQVTISATQKDIKKLKKEYNILYLDAIPNRYQMIDMRIMDIVKKHTSEAFNVTVEKLESLSRTDVNLQEAKHLARYLTKKFTSRLSLEAIGTLIGGVDHAATLNSIKAVENLIHVKFGDDSFRLKFNKVKKLVLEEI